MDKTLHPVVNPENRVELYCCLTERVTLYCLETHTTVSGIDDGFGGM
jgi:hypothetical protein